MTIYSLDPLLSKFGTSSCSMSWSNCCFLTCKQIYQEADQVVWYSHLLKIFPKFVVIHTVKGFGLVNKAEVDVFLELFCFFCDQTDVGNLISSSSAFSKPSLKIWKFSVHVLLKPHLENFEHYFASMWDECNCAVVEHSLALSFFEIGMKTAFFQSYGYCWLFQICWYIKCSTFTASSFRIWNISPGFPSLPLALFIMKLPKSHLTLYPGCPALGEWSHHRDYLSHEDPFCIVLLCIVAMSS